MNCVFQLKAYQIENVAIALNEKFDKSLSSHTGDIASALSINPHRDDPCKYCLFLEIKVTPTANKERNFFPYFVSIKGRAFVDFKSSCPREEVDRVLRLNGVSILYGLLRAQVAQITAQSVHGQFLLPTINFAEQTNAQNSVESAKAAKDNETR